MFQCQWLLVFTPEETEQLLSGGHLPSYYPQLDQQPD